MNGKQNGSKVGKSSGPVARLIAKLGRAVIRHLSDLARESLKQPGSWRCLEIVYRNEPRTLLDRFFLSSRSARGARNRLRILQEEICKCIEQHSRFGNPVKIINFGSGPGQARPSDFMYLFVFLSPILEAFFFTVSVERPKLAATLAVGLFGKSFLSKLTSLLDHKPLTSFFFAIV